MKPGQMLELEVRNGRLEIELSPVDMRLESRRHGSVTVPAEELPPLTADLVRQRLESTPAVNVVDTSVVVAAFAPGTSSTHLRIASSLLVRASRRTAPLRRFGLEPATTATSSPRAPRQ
jgi:hypothetical protein